MIRGMVSEVWITGRLGIGERGTPVTGKTVLKPVTGPVWSKIGRQDDPRIEFNQWPGRTYP